ncbi:ADP-ribosylation factor-binding protein GGA1 isoform X2 [Wyeomyia smithii]|uniref:ADP-ribosylation factor-binding protein GGA1 isoform X2 n=1 Tax=Wyeomyia smithii TaxID=174621 RepID=UPI002467C2A8|nr:ADP-ribosylation factor-binding protein GGA1 isoform X2 [Wyeomyia smithii]
MDPAVALDNYLRKAVNPNNNDLDISALDQFCLILKKDPKLMINGSKLLAERIQSSNTKEVLLSLEALEECMETCGKEFQSEINKFRFLNELIKLVSKKYNGDKTPREVSERILNILLTWTNKYDNCVKIQEAYHLLKTQGIEHHPQQNVVVKSTPKSASRSNLDEKDFFKLRELIHSSKQEDRDKANLLIQNFYRDDERRTQMKNRRLAELQKVEENTKLLDEMLSQYRPGDSSEEDLAIIREIFESCEGMHPTIIRLAEETQQSEGMLEKIFEVNDALTQVLDKYRQLKLDNSTNQQLYKQSAANSTSTAQTVSSPQTSYTPNIVGSDPLDTLFDISTIPSNSDPVRSTFDDLSEIFSSTISTDELPKAYDASSSSSVLNTDTILTPLLVSNGSLADRVLPEVKSNADRYRNIQNLIQANTNGNASYSGIFQTPNTNAINKPVSADIKSAELDTAVNPGKALSDLDSIVNGIKSTLLTQSGASGETQAAASFEKDNSSDEDDIILNPVISVPEECRPVVPVEATVVQKPQFKSLSEIVVDLDNIQPSREPPRTVWDDKEGLQITLNFTKDHPREDVSVIVISTINQGRDAIPSFHFDASVRKPCKLRLLAASSDSLPGTKPFRPPTDGITQVLLLANPSGEAVDLTCILTYCVGDDPDPIKESIVMKEVPFIKE